MEGGSFTSKRRSTITMVGGKQMSEKAYELVELAKRTGQIKKGTNEVTKALERGKAKAVIVAEDASPKEIIMHIPLIAEEKQILCIKVPSKEELGVAAGMAVGTASVAVLDEGEGKEQLEALKAE